MSAFDPLRTLRFSVTDDPQAWIVAGVRVPKFIIAALSGLLVAAAHPAPEDFVLVAEAVEALSKSSSEAAPAGVLPPDLEVWDNDTGKSSIANLAAYAGECPLKRIGTLTMGTPAAGNIVLEVRWVCSDPKRENEAYFWIEDGRLSSVSFGAPKIIRR
jgi:hypothetical protein